MRTASRLQQRQRRKLRKADLSDPPLPGTGASSDAPQSKAWALGNLRGRAGGFRRGTLSLADVTGAVRVAQSWDLSLPEIRAALLEHGLHWDDDAGRTIDYRRVSDESFRGGVVPGSVSASDSQQARLGPSDGLGAK